MEQVVVRPSLGDVICWLEEHDAQEIKGYWTTEYYEVFGQDYYDDYFEYDEEYCYRRYEELNPESSNGRTAGLEPA